ncbi:GNAT family N-acetyltransferase [Bacillus sp. FJAT-49736]|uniref:GNAT family N-acetyltransferase n=1 Tax=Bacillus sp. FJAT-49736 TaxID=2833582 RepID=UPI001BCA1BBC|nr:GNAT family N-acetyltransferase [Bacillus sp. FJAT-49736]
MNIVKVTSEDELQDAFQIRKIVFVEEQKVPEEEEIDQYEKDAAHFVLYDEGKPIGAGRFRIVDEKGKVERICVLSSYRGKGAGKVIMEAIEQYASENNLKKLKLNAQTHAIPFYEKLNYEIISGEFLDAGIPHKTMEKTL